jgi:type II secretory pathway component PulJ
MIGADFINMLRKYRLKQNKHQAAGFSFMEIIVSVSLFTVIILSTTQIFKMVIDSQRSAIATQNVQESLKYFLEVTAKEMRMAQRNDVACLDVPANRVFAVGANSLGQTLSFKNYYGQCVRYYLGLDTNGVNKRFKIRRDTQDDFISPASIRIDNLGFTLQETDFNQPLVTVTLKAFAINMASHLRSEMTIQTSIASRYYK